jgi:hypothetical protein
MGGNNPEDAGEDDFIPNLLAWEEPLPELVVDHEAPMVHVNINDLMDNQSTDSDVEDEDLAADYFAGWRASPIFNELCRLSEEYLVHCNARNDFRRIVYLGLLKTRYEEACDNQLSVQDHVMLLNYAIELNHLDLIKLFYDKIKHIDSAVRHVHNLHPVYRLLLD